MLGRFFHKSSKQSTSAHTISTPSLKKKHKNLSKEEQAYHDSVLQLRAFISHHQPLLFRLIDLKVGMQQLPFICNPYVVYSQLLYMEVGDAKGDASLLLRNDSKALQFSRAVAEAYHKKFFLLEKRIVWLLGKYSPDRNIHKRHTPGHTPTHTPGNTPIYTPVNMTPVNLTPSSSPQFGSKGASRSTNNSPAPFDSFELEGKMSVDDSEPSDHIMIRMTSHSHSKLSMEVDPDNDNIDPPLLSDVDMLTHAMTNAFNRKLSTTAGDISEMVILSSMSTAGSLPGSASGSGVISPSGSGSGYIGGNGSVGSGNGSVGSGNGSLGVTDPKKKKDRRDLFHMHHHRPMSADPVKMENATAAKPQVKTPPSVGKAQAVTKTNSNTSKKTLLNPALGGHHQLITREESPDDAGFEWMTAIEGEAAHVEVLTAEELTALESDDEMVKIKKCILGIMYCSIAVVPLCRLVGATLVLIKKTFPGDLPGGISKEALAVSSLMLLHYAIPMVTSRTVKAIGKDRPMLVDFTTKVARILMKLGNHTLFASGNMAQYNNLVRHLFVPFERFCQDVCFEGNDFMEEIEVPKKKVFLRLFTNCDAAARNSKDIPELEEIKPSLTELLNLLLIVNQKGAEMSTTLRRSESENATATTTTSSASADWHAPSDVGLGGLFDNTNTATDFNDETTMVVTYVPSKKGKESPTVSPPNAASPTGF